VSAIIEMAGVKKQRICIKFFFKLNKPSAETHRMLKEAFGKQDLSQARTCEWFKRFKDGRKSVEDRKHSSRPSACITPDVTIKETASGYFSSIFSMVNHGMDIKQVYKFT
jgi:hypothetical protein